MTKQIIRNCARRFLLVLAALVLGLQIYRWNANKLIGNSLPMPFGYGISIVLSGSMEPALSVNDLVLVRQTATVQPGDVIVYASGRSLVIHRVLEVGDETVITKGDANNVADEPVARSAVKGKMIAYVPKVGAAIRVIQTPAGTTALLAAAVLLVELSYRRERRLDDLKLEAIREEIRRLREEQQ